MFADAIPTTSQAPPRWARWECVTFALFVAALMIGLPSVVHEWWIGTQDSSMYLICARSLARGEGYSFLGEPFNVRPPGLSALLAPIVAWRGLDWGTIHFVFGTFGVAAVALLAAFLRARVGLITALAIALSIALVPGFQSLGNQVLSDVLGVALLMVGLLTARKSERQPGLRGELYLGLVIGASAYVRSAALFLVPAIWLSRILRKRPPGPWISFAAQRLLLFAAVAAVVLVPWSLRNAGVQTKEPVDQVALSSFSTWWLHEDAGDSSSPRFGFDAIVARIPERAAEFVAAVGQREFTDGRPGEPDAFELGTSLALLLGIGWVAFKRRDPAELFVFVYAAFLCTFRSHLLSRYALPVYFVGLPAVVELAQDLARRVSKRAPTTQLATMAMLAIAWADFQPHAGWKNLERTHVTQMRWMEAVRAKLSPDEIVGAEFGWHLSLLLDRPVYSFRRAIKRYGIEAGTESVIDRYGVQTIALMPDGREQAFADYVLGSYGQNARRAGDAVLVRVRP